MADHLPEHYEKLLKSGKLSKEEAKTAHEEIDSILKKMNKGLEIMKGQKLEKKVMENKVKFEKCLEQFKAIK